FPPVDVAAEDLACVYYTSGTTGTPKGVVLPHRAVTDLVVTSNVLTVHREDCVPLTANPAFDAFNWELWSTLSSGGRLLILDRQTVLDPEALADAIQKHGVTVMFLTTGLLHQMARVRPTLFAPLRALVTGGEALDARRMREVFTSDPPGVVVNGYGPTETTTISASYDIRQLSDLPETGTVPIGHATGATVLHVVDDAGERVTPGGDGELLIGGPGLALGYLGRPELTKERFVDDPFVPGATVYRTGDIVHVRPDGALVFVGRGDSQIKLRGFRIEPGEIESVLRADSRVADAVVWAYEPDSGERRLAAQVVPRGTPASNLGESLRLMLAERLPAYLVPAGIDVVAEFPLTPHGKLDRRALRPLRSTRGAAPRTAAEAVVRDIFAEMLSLPRDAVAADVGFFDLGGSSLSGVRLVARLSTVFGVDLRGRVVHDADTPAALAAHIKDASRPPFDRPGPPTAWPGTDGAPTHLTVDANTHRSLTRFAAGRDTTSSLVLHAALAATLSRLGAGTNVVIGSAVPGGVVAVPADVSGDPTFTELTAGVGRSALLAYLHQTPSRAGWPDGVLLAVAGPPEPAAIRIEVTERQSGSAVPEGIAITAHGGPAAAELARHWLTLLDAALADPARRISKLPVITTSRADRPLLTATVPELFAARRHSAAPALVLPDRTISHAELGSAGDALASALVARGAGPGTVVASDVSAPDAFVITLLGVARTGAIHALPQSTAGRAICLVSDRPAGSDPLILSPHQSGDGPAPPDDIVTVDHPVFLSGHCLHGPQVITDVVARRAEGLRTGWLPEAVPGLAAAAELLGVLAAGGTIVVPADDTVDEMLGPIPPPRACDNAIVVAYGPDYNPPPDHRGSYRGGQDEAHVVRAFDTTGGHPVGANELLVLDASLHPAPPGVWGALCVVGDAIALGYPDRPGLSG
ncbi:MAG TPA: AMP-binding protein, partial [Pseudonocardiaceae bacterium]|nr:AMP-binding protein [Pseudonocardiaceae bacterium]